MPRDVAPLAIPLHHLVVTGQTQESGKTTTLEALVAQSELRAIAFVTKRGEGSFAGGLQPPPAATETRGAPGNAPAASF